MTSSEFAQTSQGVVFATFELEVDSLMSLRINYTDTLPLYTTAYTNASASIVSAVMFRSAPELLIKLCCSQSSSMLFTSCAKTIICALMTMHNMHLTVTNTALLMNKLVWYQDWDLIGR